MTANEFSDLLHRMVRGERIRVDQPLSDEAVAALDSGLCELYDMDTGRSIPFRCSDCGERLLWRNIPTPIHACPRCDGVGK